jgi:hypothetical protein
VEALEARQLLSAALPTAPAEAGRPALHRHAAHVRHVNHVGHLRHVRQLGRARAAAVERAVAAAQAPIVRPDHIVVVIEEDRAANALGDPNMPYFNQLAGTGLVYANSHGVARPSRPDYLALFSGSTQGVTDNYTAYPLFSGPNLARSLNAAGLSFTGYAETLPYDGSLDWYASDPADPDHHPDAYFRGYNPMAHFADYGPGRTNADVNRTFASFPSDYSTLPTVSFIIPNNFHNTHGSNEAPYTDASSDYDRLRINADAWLRQKLDGYLQWAKTHNSLLIVTGDAEDLDRNPENGITTIVNGDPDLFVPGTNTRYVDHYAVLRTITDMYGLAPLGNAAGALPFDINESGQLTTSADAPRTTSTTLTSSNPSSLYGQPVTLTATVAAGTAPSGTVTFTDGTTVLGTAPLDNSGRAAITLTNLAVGSHTLTASYAGNANFAPSTSPPLAQNVTAAPNDAFASRISLAGSSVTATGSNVGATKETGEPNHVGNAGGRSVWWTWTAPFSGTAVIDTLSSSFDTLLAVYTGSAVSALSAVSNGANDDSPAGNTLTSKVTIAVTAGTTYQVAVDGYNGASGNVTLHLNLSVPAPAAPTGVNATDGAYSDKVRVTWGGVSNAAAYEVWRGTSSSTGSATRIATDLAATTFDDTTATPGTTYWYWVKSKNSGGTSGFSAGNSGFRAVAAPANNNFASRITLTGTTVKTTGTNVGGTKESGEPKHAGNNGGKSVWWTWTAPSSGTVTIDTVGSSFDTLLAVYRGSAVSSLTAVPGGSNDDSPTGGTQASRVRFAVTANTVYQIAVDGYNAASGNITLNLALAVP